MRLSSQIKSLKNYVQNEQTTSRYHIELRGWIYSKMKGSNFNWINENKSFKPFCFSSRLDRKIKKLLKFKMIKRLNFKELIKKLKLEILKSEKLVKQKNKLYI